MAHHHRHHYPTGAQAQAELGRGLTVPSIWILALALLAAIGVVALVLLVLSGPEPRSKWGYTAAVTGFLLSTAHSAPLIAFATRLAKGYWAVPLRRAAEIYFLAGLVTTPLFLVLLAQLPSFQGRRSIWNDWPGGAGIYDAVAMIVFSATGLALLYFSTRPDLSPRGWGAPKQWSVLTTGLILLGAFYAMMYAYVHIFMVSDLAMSLVPGWKSAIYPAYHGVSGIQAGFATLLLTALALRSFGGMQGYLGLAQFWGAAKPMLALSLLFFYFSWDEFVTYWYGRLPEEISLLTYLMFGTYGVLFIPGFLLNFVLPFLLLIWNPIRVSINGPPRVAALIVLGIFIDRVRIYVASWSVAGPPDAHLDLAHLPPFQFPTILDVLVVVGAISAVGFLYLWALRRLPPISLWEYKQVRLLTIERPLVRLPLTAIAKPH